MMRGSAKRSGFALVDVTIAVVVFGIGVLAAITMMIHGIRLHRTTQEVERATLRLEQVADSLMWERGSGTGTRAYADGRLRWRRQGTLVHVEAWGVDTTGAPLRELWAPVW